MTICVQTVLMSILHGIGISPNLIVKLEAHAQLADCTAALDEMHAPSPMASACKSRMHDYIECSCDGPEVQSSRADKALAVDTLWDSLSLYINHCATQAGAASEPESSTQQQQASEADNDAPATTQEAAQVSCAEC